MAIGPLHYLVITFDDNRPMGEVLSELRAVRNGGLIRLIDLLFVTKSSEGLAESVEMSDLGESEIPDLAALVGDLLCDRHIPITRHGVVSGFTEKDVRDVAGGIPNGSSAAIVLFEHTWARPLAGALHRAGATISLQAILNGGRVSGS